MLDVGCLVAIVVAIAVWSPLLSMGQALSELQCYQCLVLDVNYRSMWWNYCIPTEAVRQAGTSVLTAR
jgi:hypothetical protein